MNGLESVALLRELTEQLQKNSRYALAWMLASTVMMETGAHFLEADEAKAAASKYLDNIRAELAQLNGTAKIINMTRRLKRVNERTEMILLGEIPAKKKRRRRRRRVL